MRGGAHRAGPESWHGIGIIFAFTNVRQSRAPAVLTLIKVGDIEAREDRTCATQYVPPLY
jgi:hypothetical protein